MAEEKKKPKFDFTSSVKRMKTIDEKNPPPPEKVDADESDGYFGDDAELEDSEIDEAVSRALRTDKMLAETERTMRNSPSAFGAMPDQGTMMQQPSGFAGPNTGSMYRQPSGFEGPNPGYMSPRDMIPHHTMGFGSPDRGMHSYAYPEDAVPVDFVPGGSAMMGFKHARNSYERFNAMRMANGQAPVPMPEPVRPDLDRGMRSSYGRPNPAVDVDMAFQDAASMIREKAVSVSKQSATQMLQANNSGPEKTSRVKDVPTSIINILKRGFDSDPNITDTVVAWMLCHLDADEAKEVSMNGDITPKQLDLMREWSSKHKGSSGESASQLQAKINDLSFKLDEMINLVSYLIMDRFNLAASNPPEDISDIDLTMDDDIYEFLTSAEHQTKQIRFKKNQLDGRRKM